MPRTVKEKQADLGLFDGIEDDVALCEYYRNANFFDIKDFSALRDLTEDQNGKE